MTRASGKHETEREGKAPPTSEGPTPRSTSVLTRTRVSGCHSLREVVSRVHRSSVEHKDGWSSWSVRRLNDKNKKTLAEESAEKKGEGLFVREGTATPERLCLRPPKEVGDGRTYAAGFCWPGPFSQARCPRWPRSRFPPGLFRDPRSPLYVNEGAQWALCRARIRGTWCRPWVSSGALRSAVVVTAVKVARLRDVASLVAELRP